MAESNEVAAIRAIRSNYPNVGQRTLATRIQNGTYTFGGVNLTTRSWYSIYGTIRRHDQLVAAKTQTPTLVS